MLFLLPMTTPLASSPLHNRPPVMRVRGVGNGASASLWTLSGLVLTACSSGSSEAPFTTEPDDYPAAIRKASTPRSEQATTGIKVKVIASGPLEGARAYVDTDGVDTDGDGALEYDLMIAENPDNHSLRSRTDIFGEIPVPGEYADKPMVVGNGTDTQTGKNAGTAIRFNLGSVGNSWLSLPRDDENAESPNARIITPLTDLIAREKDEDETSQQLLDGIFGENAVLVADILQAENYLLTTDTIKAQLISNAAIFRSQHDDVSLAGGSATKSHMADFFRPYREKQTGKSVFDPATDLAEIYIVSRKGVKREHIELLNQSQSTPFIVGPGSLAGNITDDITLAHLDDRAKIEDFFGFQDPLGNKTAPDGMAGVYIKSQQDESGAGRATLRVNLNGGGSATAPDTGKPAVSDYLYVPFADIDAIEFNIANAADDQTHANFRLPFFIHDGEEYSENTGDLLLEFKKTPRPLEYTPEAKGGVVLSGKVAGWQIVGQFALSEVAPDGVKFTDISPLLFRIDGMEGVLAQYDVPQLESATAAVFSMGGDEEVFRIRKHEQGERFIFEVNAQNYNTAMHGLPSVRIHGYDALNEYTEIPFTITDDVLIYENHPLHKPVYDFGDADLATETTWELRDAANGGGADNALFRITDDGRIWWRNNPDYETPQNFDGDNIYEVVAHATTGTDTITHTVYVRVQDIAGELRIGRGLHGGTDVARYDNVPDALLPEEYYVEHLVWGISWEMPDTGPLTLTWSLALNPELWQTAIPELGMNRPTDDDGNDANENRLEISKLDTLAAVENAREQMEDAFGLFEEIGNFKFIEVDHTDDIAAPHMTIHFHTIEGRAIGYAYAPGNGTSISMDYGFVDDDLTDDSFDFVAIHEIGHVLGLNHPFPDDYDAPTDNRLGWPYDTDFRRGPGSEDSVMSYYCGPVNENHECQLAPRDRTRIFEPLKYDIAALEYLYGKKGTDNVGLNAYLELAENRNSVDYASSAEQVDGGDVPGHGIACGCSCCGDLRLKDKAPELFDALYVEEADETPTPPGDFA